MLETPKSRSLKRWGLTDNQQGSSKENPQRLPSRHTLAI